MILSEEHVLFQESVRALVQKEIAPYAIETDRDAIAPVKQMKALADNDMLLIKFPAEYGGGGSDSLAYALMVEEISKECAATGTAVCVHAMSADMIKQFGTEEQKKKWLPKMATAEILGGFALTEAGAGSDSAALQTIAEDKGDHYLVNGAKTFISSADFSDVLLTMVRTDPSAPGTKGMSVLVIPKDQFTVGKHEDKMGIRGAHTVEVVFKDAKVPKENLLGKLGEGFKLAMKTLDDSRLGIAAQAVGIMQGCLDDCIAYSKQRVQFGRPISANQAIQWKLADMYIKASVGRQMVWHVADLIDAKIPHSAEVSAAKAFCTESAVEVTNDAVQIQGGYGYCKPSKVERMYRDAKITMIYEGTSEVQRLVITGKLLK